MPRQNRGAKCSLPRIEILWAVEFHPEFDSEFMELPLTVQQMILARAELLRKIGPQLGRP